MTENKRYEKRMNFNVSLPDERCFKNEYCIVDEAKYLEKLRSQRE